jgi:peptide deformylase
MWSRSWVKAFRLFIIDTTPFSEDEDLESSKQNELKERTFINAKMLKEEEWCFNEGLSILMCVRI